MDDLDRLRRRLDREKKSRKAAEEIAEQKTRQLFVANQGLQQSAEVLKQRGVELQETLGYLRAIINNMADGLLVIDTGRKIKLVNPALLNMFRLRENDVINRNIDQAFESELVEFIEDYTKSQFRESVNLEINMPGNRVGRAVLSPIYASPDGSAAEHEAIGAVTIIRDFTIEKEIDSMKTDFISNVSHELRTPLTSLLGFTKIIKKKLGAKIFPALADNSDRAIQKVQEQVARNIDIMIAEGERLTNLINDVLDVAKMEAGKIEWDMKPVSMTSVINRAVAATSSLFEDNKVKLVTRISEPLADVRGDQDRLIQVLINLISNAVKFTDTGTVTCEAKWIKSNITVRVRDTGVGIAPEDIHKVFDKFKQVGNTLTDKPRGTGLGLPISKQIIEHHGGEIGVESQLGSGSTFYFSLPVSQDSVVLPSPESRTDINLLMAQLKNQIASDSREFHRDKKTVLVVDDEPNIREYLRQELESAGYIVNEAENGLDAIGLAKKVQPDVIILDVMMPTMNGFDAAAVLKNDPQTMRIPIVLLSIVEDKKRGFHIGIDRYLKKPIEADLLLNEIAMLLTPAGTVQKILIIASDEDSFRTLVNVLENAGNAKIYQADSYSCVSEALALTPHMIIVDGAVENAHGLIKDLRSKKELEKSSFILLAEKSDVPMETAVG